MKAWPVYLLAFFLGLVSCADPQEESPNHTLFTLVPPRESVKTLAPDKKLNVVTGQTIYVPAYSHIYTGNKAASFNLSVTLSIRNTDSKHSMVITSVRYFDSNGKVVWDQASQRLELGPLGSMEYFIKEKDTSGGVGANFIVNWVAEQNISQPIVETVMIGTQNTQGVSFISPGRVIQTLAPRADSLEKIQQAPGQ